MSSRRDFLLALAGGTGAILLGRNWYRQGSGLLIPRTVDGPILFGQAGTGMETEWMRNLVVVQDPSSPEHAIATAEVYRAQDRRWRPVRHRLAIEPVPGMDRARIEVTRGPQNGPQYGEAFLNGQPQCYGLTLMTAPVTAPWGGPFAGGPGNRLAWRMQSSV